MLIVQLLGGLMEGAMLFLMAAGLTLILGLTRIVNFAHGSFYMLGAFIGRDVYLLFGPDSLAGFVIAIIVAGLAVALIGLLCEMTILRRVYHSEQLVQLLITVGLVLIIRDVAKHVWGLQTLSTPMPKALAGAYRLGEHYIPMYAATVAMVGLAVMVVMFLVVRYTRAGVILRASTDDREMVGLLGVNQFIVFSSVFAVGCFLAGVAGALAAPFGSVNYLLDTTVIVGAFVVVVIGGLGNLYGAFLGALAIGMIKSLGVLYFPRLAMVLIFLIMAVVLILRSLNREGRPQL